MAAAVVLVLESLLSLLGAESPALTVAALVLAPGLALAALLPGPVRRSWTATLAGAPVLGFAVSSIGLVSLASAGVSLGPVSVHIGLAALVAVGFVLRIPDLPARPDRGEALAGLGLLGAVVLGVVLQLRVVGGFPVPGNDWAKYVLFGDEIRTHGSLLIDNPFWLLGVPFREDPAVPALYGAYLRLADQPAASLAHGITLFASLQVLSLFALVRSLWGRAAGVIGAALWAALPLGATMLGWHGLANAAALALLPLLLLYAAVLARNELDPKAAAGAGLLLVALAATHRLSAGVGVAAVAVTAAVAFALGPRRAEIARGAGLALLFGALAAPGVVYDLAERQSTFGGTLDYKAYLSTKIDVGLFLRDLTLVLAIVAGVAVVAALMRVRRDRALLPLLCTLAVVCLLAYSWVVHLPLSYTRMVYYVPLAIVPLAAVLLAKLPRPPWPAGLASLVLVAYLAAVSYSHGDSVDRFYSFANPASLRGLDAVAARLEPREVVVTDRCWSFLATWLLHTRTLPALDQADIQPKAELPRARQAREVLAGTTSGRALARRLHVRFLLVDPSCTDGNGDPSPPPRIGRPAFVSRRLVVLRLR
jgi:hypothetical protein